MGSIPPPWLCAISSGLDKSAAGRQFRDNHGDRLQYLDLVLKIMPQRPVLDDEDAEDPTSAQDRDSHQRVIDLFTSLWPIGETRMQLRVSQCQWTCRGSDKAPTSPSPTRSLVRCTAFRAQSLGSEQSARTSPARIT